ncbi:MAG: polysaccharide export protein EpsE [Burkholderiales bacterium]|nr:polysaccharide export protein EpsE [Burkholderiales bacterium]
MLIRISKRIVFVLALAVAAGAMAQSRDYQLGPGDVIGVKVFERPELSVEARVSENGTISYPLTGTLSVAGLTASATGALITKRLRDGGFVKEPFVNVGIAQFRSLQISVLGQVARPGRYPMEQSVSRVSDAIAIAGGALPAGHDVVWLVRQEGEKTVRFEIDLPAMMQSGDIAKNVVVRNGDTVFVPRAPTYFIYGEVQRAGQYRLDRDMSATQALAIGGGPTTRGTDRGMRLSRRDASGKMVTREVDPNEPILPDDVLYVRERVF